MVMVMAGLSARETTQPALALEAISENCAAEMFGTWARVVRWTAVIVGLASTVSIVRRASVSIAVAVNPALLSVNDSAIVKQPACAAAMSSSGLVPLASPNRVLNPYGVSASSPLAGVASVPVPVFRSPCQWAVAKRVMAMTGAAIPEREINGRKIRVDTEDNAQVLLDFGESVFGVVTTGFTLQQYRNPAFELYGSHGTIQMTGDDWGPEGYELWQNEVGAWQIYKETNVDWHWTDGLRHIVDCIHRKVRPMVTPEHALHVLEIMLKAPISSREGRAIQLETTFVPPAFAEDKPAPAEPAHLVHDRTRKHFETKTEGAQ